MPAHPCTGCPAFNKAQLCSTMKQGGCKLEQQKKKAQQGLKETTP